MALRERFCFFFCFSFSFLEVAVVLLVLLALGAVLALLAVVGLGRLVLLVPVARVRASLPSEEGCFRFFELLPLFELSLNE